MFSVLRDSVWSKNKGGGLSPPGPSPGSATVNPTLPQSLHGHDVYRRGRKQATTKKSLWTRTWLSGLFNNMKFRQHLTKWVSWNNRDEDWNNSNSLFYATFSLPSLCSDLKVSIKLNFYRKERFFTETINSSVWIGKIQKKISSSRGTRKPLMSRQVFGFPFCVQIVPPEENCFGWIER